MAHAIEKCAHEINHGEAVAMGIAMICDAAVRGGMLAAPDRDRIHALLEKTGFTLTAPVPTARLLREIGIINAVFPTGIGSCRIVGLTLDEFSALMG